MSRCKRCKEVYKLAFNRRVVVFCKGGGHFAAPASISPQTLMPSKEEWRISPVKRLHCCRLTLNSSPCMGTPIAATYTLEKVSRSTNSMSRHFPMSRKILRI
jgi:hypothetical protein